MSPARKSISVLGINHVIETAKKFGIPIEDFLKQVDIDETMIPELETRVDFKILVKIFKFCEEEYGPRFPLHVAREIPIGKFSLIDYAMANCENLGEAYKTLVKYWNLASNISQHSLVVYEGEARLGTTYPKSVLESLPSLVESTLFHFLNIGRAITKTEWVPNKVLLQNGATDVDEYSKTFKAPVYNNQHVSFLIFESTLLDLPVIGASRELKTVLESAARKLHAKLPHSEGIIDSVSGIIKNNLESKNYSIEKIAEELNLSVRTLQRKLKNASISYNEILSKVRLSYAETLLLEGNLNIYEISLLLGYKDPSAFYKFLKQQLGKTPDEYRKENEKSN